MQLYFSSPAKWRAWLAKNHDTVREVWLVFYKAHTGKPTLSYDDALDEALCYGWIDSLIKRLDDDRFLRRFGPRTNNRKWSAVNLRHMKRLIESGRMTDIGRAKLATGVKGEVAPPQQQFLPPPPFFTRALAKHPTARDNFANMAPSYQRRFVGWVMIAKQDETRRRRLAEVLRLLEKNEKLGLK